MTTDANPPRRLRDIANGINAAGNQATLADAAERMATQASPGV